jgi:hypothetical protein
MKEERRLVWRVLRDWNEIKARGRFPRIDDIRRWMLGDDGPNCLLIAVQAPIELSHFVSVGVNLAVAALQDRYAGRRTVVTFASGGVGAPRPDHRRRCDASWGEHPISQRPVAAIWGRRRYRSRARRDELSLTARRRDAAEAGNFQHALALGGGF